MSGWSGWKQVVPRLGSEMIKIVFFGGIFVLAFCFLVRIWHNKHLQKLSTQNPFKKVIFLDFDGVLHAGFSGNFEHLPKFEKLLKRYPDVSVVISSDWRGCRSIDELRKLFSTSVRDQIVGKTPEIFTGNRQTEIEAFCNTAQVGDFLILDDAEHLFHGSCANLYVTRHEVGLDDEDLLFIENWMRGK